MKSPIIGIASQFFTQPHPSAFGAEETYVKWLLPLGARPLVIPFPALADHAAAYCDLCDGFLIPGGTNITPSLYRTVRNHFPGLNNPDRDRSEITLVAAALERDLPILGICHGHQLLNVALGGSIRQSIPTKPINHRPAPAHRPATSRPAPAHHPATSHPVHLLPDTPLAELLSADTIQVNSYHYQALDQLAPSLRAMAIAPDGVIEAVYRPASSFCWGFQWHPEKIPDAHSSRLIGQAFLAACRKTPE